MLENIPNQIAKIDPFDVYHKIIFLYKKYFFELLIFGIINSLLTLVINGLLLNQKIPTYSLDTAQYTVFWDTFFRSLFLDFISFLFPVLLVSIFIIYLDQNENMSNTNILTATKLILPRIIPIILVNIVVGLIVAGGILLLIIPGLIWYFMYSQAYLYVLLENKSISESLGLSKRLTNKNKHNIFYINTGVVMIIGIITLIANQFFKGSSISGENSIDYIIDIFTFGLDGIMVFAIWEALKKVSVSSNQ